MSSPTTAIRRPDAATQPRGMATRFRLQQERDTEPSPPTSFVDDALVQRPRVHIAPGRLIPGTRYRAIRWLGEGGMGVVYEAEHEDIGRRVAVKILRHHYSDDADALELFRAEARATAQVGSENILQVHDFAQLPDGRLMMAMELLQGHDLMAEMGLPMDPARVLAIARQCCKALAAAHDAGLVHRDIKPENIFLIDSVERPAKVKIVDFGIAVVLSGDKTKRKLVGTPQYIAPEAITTNEVAPALDQYALGVVIYEMLTGTTAFEAPSVAEMIQAQLNEMPYPPSRVQSSVHPAFDQVVMRCLAKDPAERFADVRDLEAALCEVQIEVGIVTPWDDLPLPDVDPQRKQWLFENMPNPRVGAIRPQSRSKLAIVLGIVAALFVGGAVTGGIMWHRAGLNQQPERTAVDELADAARAAASRGQWVYPPLDDVDAPTAYSLTRELEQLEGHREAQDAAAALRTEFATSLKQLGDYYWARDDEGSRLVAKEFYWQAQVFDKDVELGDEQRANDRDVEALEARARNVAFTDDELKEAEAIAAAVTSEPAQRRARVEDHARNMEKRAEQSMRIAETVRHVQPGTIATKLQDPPPPSGGAEAKLPSATPAEAEPVADGEPEPGEDLELGGGGAGSSAVASARNAGGGPEPLVRERRDPDRARGLARQGMAAYRAGDYAQATLLFEQALAQNPNDQMALQGMRDAYFDSGDYGRASRYGRRVVAVAPKTASHRLRLGDAYFKVGRNRQAEKEYEKALELGDARAQERLDRVRRRLGE